MTGPRADSPSLPFGLDRIPWWVDAIVAVVAVVRGLYLVLAPSAPLGQRLVGVVLAAGVAPACACSARRKRRSM